MYTLTLSQEDFKEEAYWIALCDSLDVPFCEGIEEIVLYVSDINYEGKK